MTESNQEHLSSLMDGELDAKAQEFLVRRLATDSSMSATWRRYHLVRACLHQEFSQPTCIAERVSSALSGEPETASPRFPAWLRPVAGSAIAASVALVAIVGINANLVERQQQDVVVEQSGFVSQPTSLDRTFSQQAVPVSFSEASQEDRQRINTYVLRHNQAVGGGGFVSYLPIVTSTPTEASEVVIDDLDSGPVRPEK
jgi:sigma-E factor negative regulatory protein RseA